MDPVEEDNPPPAAAAAARPRIVQLSPAPSNIYESDRFYYDPAGVLSAGPVAAIVAFAAAHGHPVFVHDCPDIQEFQAAHPSAIICPISEVPPPILARGLTLLARQSAPVAPAAAVAAPALEVAHANIPQPLIVPTAPSSSAGESAASRPSRPLLSHESLSRGGDPPSTGVIVFPTHGHGGRAPVGFRVPQSIRVPPSRAFRAAGPVFGPPRPDPDGLADPPCFVGGRQFSGYVASSPLHGGDFANHGGSSSNAFTFPSLDDHWRGNTFPGGLPPAVPAFVHGPSRPLPASGGLTPAAALVASTLASAVLSLRPLPQEDLSGSSASNLTMSFWMTPPAPAVAPVAPVTMPAGAPMASMPPVLTVPSPPCGGGSCRSSCRRTFGSRHCSSRRARDRSSSCSFDSPF